MIRHWIALVALVFLSGSPAATEQKPPDTHRGIISGRVVDAETGAPVSGVLIAAASVRGPDRTQPGSRRALLTDAQGRFAIGELPDGDYTLTASMGGRGFSPSGFLVTGLGHQIGAYLNGGFGQRRPDGPLQTIRLASSAARSDVTIRLWKGGAIGGSVVDEAGEPLVGLVVSAVRRASDGALLTGPTTRTDDRGVYRVGTLAPGDYVIVVPQAQMLMPDAQIELRLTNSLLPAEREGRQYVYQTTFHQSVISLRAGEERLDVNVQLQPVPAVAVEGTVVGAAGPAAGVGVHIAPADAGDGMSVLEVAGTVSNPDGSFAFPAVPMGAYRLLAIPNRAPDQPWPGWAAQPLEIGSEPVRDVAVVLQPGRQISGRVEFHGTAAPPAGDALTRATVPLTRATPLLRSGDGSVSGRFDAADSFTIRDVPPGRYIISPRDFAPDWTLQFVSVGGRDVTDAVLRLGDRDIKDAVVVFTDTPATIGGSVTGAAGGDDRHLAVFLFPSEQARWPDVRISGRVFRTVRVSATGTFTIPNVIPGEYLAVAVPDDLAGDWPSPDFLARLAPQATTIRVLPGEAASVTLRQGTLR